MWPGIAAAISVTTGKPFSIEQRASVGGGCINPAYRIEGRGVVYFVKTSSADRRETFAAEASALEEIAASGTLRVPRVVCHGGDETASWLVLEHIALQRHGDLERLGRRLAALHRVRAESFGWSRNNVLGATPQINTPAADWLQFWREQRLGYQLRLAADNGYRGALQRSGRRLMDRLSDLLSGHRPAPSLLHGDLWSGN
ncbi:MAG TPA: fructosamine kinase family protein, partial [Burkholderiales bacterium]|nr:fructosamine kinase family protein [Burkholderiales bacterium]